ncbi:MAG: hypothetical protein PF795_04595 [Kiritimatiellae bacterium]|jgi:hypothetical protein|nr:hypothetical protein [Kiritimatiellia bacterium]
MKLPEIPASGDHLDASWGQEVVEYLRSITPQPSPTVKPSTGANGTTFKASPGRGGTGGLLAPPWWPGVVIEEEEYRLRIRTAAIDQVIPRFNWADEDTEIGLPDAYLVLTPGTSGLIVAEVDWGTEDDRPVAAEMGAYTGVVPGDDYENLKFYIPTHVFRSSRASEEDPWQMAARPLYFESLKPILCGKYIRW